MLIKGILDLYITRVASPCRNITVPAATYLPDGVKAY